MDLPEHSFVPTSVPLEIEMYCKHCNNGDCHLANGNEGNMYVEVLNVLLQRKLSERLNHKA